MDETSYRNARDGIGRPPCIFEKALQARCAECRVAARVLLAERETVVCDEPRLQSRCREFLELLRTNALFALKPAEPAAPRPHAQIVKLQCGGLAGLRDALDDPGAAGGDVAALVCAATDRWGELDRLPYSRIVQGIAAWRGRRRRRDEGDPS